MQVNRQHFINLIGLTEPGLSSSDIITQGQSVIFKDKSIFAFNDRVFVEVPFESDIQGAVPADRLLKLLGKYTDEEIEVYTTEKEFRIKSGTKRASGVKMEKEVTLPLDQVTPPEAWEPLPEAFSSSLILTLPSASKSLTKPILTAVHLTGEGMETCNNIQLSRVNLKLDFLGEEEILIPASLAASVVQYSPNEVGLTDDWAWFRNEDGVVIAVRTMRGEFPNLDSVIPKKGTVLKWPPQMEAILERAAVMVQDVDKDADKSVKITLEENKLEVRGEDDLGWHEETSRVRYAGPQISFLVHPGFLGDLMSAKIQVCKDRLLFTHENLIHVVLLITE